MKQTPMPRRKKPMRRTRLNPGTGLKPGGPLPRYTELRSKPKAKPRRDAAPASQPLSTQRAGTE